MSSAHGIVESLEQSTWGGEERSACDEIVNVRGGDDPPPPFFRVGLFPLPKRTMGVREGILPFLEGVFPPRRRSQKMRTAAALLALIISFAGLKHPRSNRPS